MSDHLCNIIARLNDSHQWSRQQIADWLDTLPIDLTVQQKENAECHQLPALD